MDLESLRGQNAIINFYVNKREEYQVFHSPLPTGNTGLKLWEAEHAPQRSDRINTSRNLIGDLFESEQLESVRRWKVTSNNSALYPVIAYSMYTDIYNRKCFENAQDMG